MGAAPIAFEDVLATGASDKRIEVLRSVHLAGAISLEAGATGVSYKAAWQAVETLSNLAGVPLMEKAVGGAGGGGARLTAQGLAVLRAADLLQAARSQALAKISRSARGSAIAPGGLAALGLRTSMRNNLPCTVQAIVRTRGSVRVQLALADGQVLASRITLESLQLLGLAPGKAALAMFKATALVMLLLWGGQKLMRWWLKTIDQRKSDELFMLNILLMTLGLAWLTEHAGLSLAMGAFLAGMLIAETDYKQRVENDIRPFHDVLLGLFFITIGMKLDWAVLYQQWAWVLVLALVPIAVKALLVAVLARGFGAPTGVAARTGIYLAQAGEFGFVLLSLGLSNGLIDPLWSNPVLAAMVLSMVATPFLIQHADRLVYRFAADDWLSQSLNITALAQHTINIDHHVIVCGFGRTGKNLCNLLESEQIGYLALELHPDVVHSAMLAGHRVEYGDATQLASLMSAGLARASAVVISYEDTPSALKVLALVQAHAPEVPVVVRTRDDHDLNHFREAGARDVVPEIFEASLSLASQTLHHIGIPARRVRRLVQSQRQTRYAGFKDDSNASSH